jgi:hypothetical protein
MDHIKGPGSPVQHPYVSLAADAAKDFTIGALFLYGYIYTAYKYGNPLSGGTDFLKYKEMVGDPFDFSATYAPFVLRQIPAIVASIFYKLGFHYDTGAVIDLIGFDQDTKRRFFALILSSGLAVCLSFTILAGYLRTKLRRNGMIELFALFGVFAAWFWFATAIIAPQTIAWGWLVSSLFLIAFLERNVALTFLACLMGLFSRETTLIFALVMFLARVLFDGDRRRSDVASVLVLAAGCLTYLLLRKLFTSGYEHQIDLRSHIDGLISFRPSRDFIFQSVLSQGLIAMLLLGIAMKRLRYALYLLLAAAAITVIGIGARESRFAWVWGETLPFYAIIFFLTQFDALQASPGASHSDHEATESLRRG